MYIMSHPVLMECENLPEYSDFCTLQLLPCFFIYTLVLLFNTCLSSFSLVSHAPVPEGHGVGNSQ